MRGLEEGRRIEKGVEGRGREGGGARTGRNIGEQAARGDKMFHKTDIDSVLFRWRDDVDRTARRAPRTPSTNG